MWLLAVETGLRPEEFLALAWNAVDLPAARIKVERPLVRFPKGIYKFDEPKNESSRRTIPLSKNLVETLKSHRRRLLEHRLQMGSYWTELNLVFPTEICTPFTLSNLNRKFKECLLRSELNQSYLVYDLRHTYATSLLEEGENIKVVSERLGHQSVMITCDTYLHVSEGMQAIATLKIETIMDNLNCVKLGVEHTR